MNFRHVSFAFGLAACAASISCGAAPTHTKTHAALLTQAKTPAASGGANLLTANPSFEAPVGGGGHGLSTSVSGWEVDYFAYDGFGVQDGGAADGKRALSLNRGGRVTTALANRPAVRPGQMYRMAFALMPGSPANWGYGHSTLSVDPTDRATLYVCNWGYSNPWATGVWQFAGGKWNQLSSDKYGPVTRAFMAAADPANPRRIVAVTNDNPFSDITNASGVWLSEDGGKTWTAQNSGLPMLRVQSVRFCPDKSGLLVVGLNGRGFYKTRISETVAARP